MGKYDDLIGGGKIVIDVEEVLNEEAANRVDSEIKKQKKKWEEPVKVNLDAGNAVKRLNDLTDAAEKLKKELKDALDSNKSFEDVNKLVTTYNTLKRNIKAASNEAKDNKELVAKSNKVLKDTKKIIDSLTVSQENLNKAQTKKKKVSTKKEVSAIKEQISAVDELAKTETKVLEQQTESIETKTKAIDAMVAAEQRLQDKVKENTVAFSDAAKAQERYMYHAGKFRDNGRKAESLGQLYPGRGTGFYGTGTYGVDLGHINELGYSGTYNSRPWSIIDTSMYNLFDATEDEMAWSLHRFLKSLTDKIYGVKGGEKINSLYKEFNKIFSDNAVITTYDEFKNVVQEIATYVSENKDSYPAFYDMDSAPTMFMKKLGYDGINTLGSRYANTEYGTVIYELKEESIICKEITDELYKQKILAGNIGEVIAQNTSKLQKEVNKSQKTSSIEKQVESAQRLQDEIAKTAHSIQDVGVLLGEFQKNYSESFNNTINEVVSSFGALNTSNSDELYNILIAKEREYLDAIRARQVALQEFMQANGKVAIENQKSVEFMNKYSELAEGILTGNIGLEEANKQLQEFVDTLSKIDSDKIDAVTDLFGENNKLIMGSSGETYAGKTPINFKYAVMSVEDLVMSHDAYGTTNPNYPTELQPRDRSRAMSTAQILGMVKNIIPELLTSSSTAQNGSPIVSRDGIVVGGNARSAALLEAYKSGHADGYKSYIIEHATEFGLNKDNMPTHPVLVRVVDIEGGLDVLARQLNEATTAGYSATEQALVNEELVMQVISKLNLDESANLNSEANKDFIKSFINLLSDNQKNEMVTKDGSLSAVGLAKTKQAIAGAAYGSKGMLENLEQISPELLNISNALMAGAAKAADIRYNIENGFLNDLGVVATILKGLDLLKAARGYGQNIEEYLSQDSFFGSDYSAEDVAIGKFFEANVRNATNLRNMIDVMLDFARSAGDPNQISFGDIKDVSLSDIIRNAFVKYAEKYQKSINYDELVGGYLPAEAGSRNDKRVDRTTTPIEVPVTPDVEQGAVQKEISESIGSSDIEVPVAPKVKKPKLSDGSDGNAAELKNAEIYQKNIDDAIGVLRSAKDNKTSVIDLTDVYSPEQLEKQLHDMVQAAVGAELSVDNVIVQDDIARITLYNEALGVTISQMYQLREAADKAADEVDESAKKLQLDFISESVKHSPRKAAAYAEAEQKKLEAEQKQIEKDNRWLLGQMSKLNTQESAYRYSDKQISGDTTLVNDAKQTIDGLVGKIKETIQGAMDGALTEGLRNEIIKELNELTNEIKIAQYKQYASTTMSPTQIDAARKEIEYTLDALEAKAKKGNVFTQLEKDHAKLRERLRNPEVEGYVKDGTDIKGFVDEIRVLSKKTSAAISEEGLKKKDQQDLQNHLNLRKRLYSVEKDIIALEAKGELTSSKGLAAQRDVQALRGQVAASRELLKTREELIAQADVQESKLQTELQQFAKEQKLNSLLSQRLEVRKRIQKLEQAKSKTTGEKTSEVIDSRIKSAQAELDAINAEIKSHDRFMQYGGTVAQDQKFANKAIEIADKDAIKVAQELDTTIAGITNRIQELKQSSDFELLPKSLQQEVTEMQTNISKLDVSSATIPGLKQIENEWANIDARSKEAIKTKKAYVDSAWEYRFQKEYQYNGGRSASEQKDYDGLVGQIRAEEENAKQYEQNVKSIYKNILANIQDINKLDAQMNKISLQDGGSGLYSSMLQNMQNEKSALIAETRSLAEEIQQILSITPASGQGALAAFFEDARVKAVLTEEEILKVGEALKQTENIRIEFGAKMNEQIQPVVEKLQSLKSLVKDGVIAPDSQVAKNILSMDSTLGKKYGDFKTYGTSKDATELLRYVDSINTYVNTLDKAIKKEQEYFAGKTKYSSATTKDTLAADTEKFNQKLVDNKKQLENAAKAFAGDGALITNFTQGADGIAKLDFSVFDTATNSMRTFRMEMGNLTDGMFVMEATANKSMDSINKALARAKAAQKQLSAAESLTGRLGADNIDIDAETAAAPIKRLLQARENLQKAMAPDSKSTTADIDNYIKKLQLAIAEVEKMYKQYVNMQNSFDDGKATGMGEIDKNGNIYTQLSAKVREFAATHTGAQLAIGGFNDKTNTLKFTLTDVNGQVQNFTASMEGLSGTVGIQSTGINRLTSSYDRFKADLAGIGKQLMTATVGYNVFYKAISQLRTGVGYVKEIDLAMTELRKVTDATEASYAKFLSTAADTAGEIGSTVSDFTNATANFARLGYSIDESADMAKSAIIYKNVADGLDTVDEATDSIISTMKAFGIEADDTMGIIDKFNAVGNSFAITSAGIGDAMQRSASALKEGGNTIDESIALITAANSVIQNPEQVGECLPTIK